MKVAILKLINKSIYLSIFLIPFLAIPFITFSAPLFIPGQTLNPGCLPSNPDCTVSTSSTAVSYIYASSTFPSFTYGSSTYYLATNPANYINATALTSYIPYTGGTSNVNLGAHNLLVDGTTLFVDATTHSVALNNSTASGLNSFSTNYSEASGEAASAFGDGTLASGISSFAIGESSTASGDVSFAAGRSASATHANSMVFSDANGAVSSAANQATLSFGNGIILNPNGGNVGIGTTAPSKKLTVMGSVYNGINSSSQISEVTTLSSTFDNIQSVSVSGQYLYGVDSNFTSYLYIIDVSDPSSPVQVGSVAVGDFSTDFALSGHYAYTTNGGEDNISVVDISNPATPVRIATTTVGVGPSSIAISGRYVYTANYGDNTISTVDISNPSHPIQVATTSVSGSNPQTITISGRYAYVTQYYSADVAIIDISNPLSPREISSISVGNNPYSVAISGRYAYVTNSSDDNISVVDISNPALPTTVATASTGNSPTAITISGRYAYVANNSDSHISIIDISNPLAPQEIATQVVSGGFPGSVAVSGHYAYTGNTGNNTISVIDLAGTDVGNLLAGAVEAGNINVQNDITVAGFVNVGTALSVGIGGIKSDGGLSVTGKIYNGISSSSEVSRIASISIGDYPQNITISGHYAYTVNQNDTMSVIDISNPSSPVQIATTTVTSNPNGVAVSGRYAYTSNINDNTISVVDISNPYSPIQIATTSVGNYPNSIAVSGRYAYTANYNDNNISVVDISNPLAPIQVASTSVGNSPYSITISGRYAYTANNGGSSISVVDISNPLAPIQVGSTAVGSSPNSVAVSGRYAYTANNGDNTMSVIDISNPSSPIQVATVAAGPSPYSVAVSGRYAYVTDYNTSKLVIIDISNPLTPIQVASTVAGQTPYAVAISGHYAYTANNGDGTISVIDLAGTDVGNLLAGAVEAGNINVQNDITVAGFVNVGTALSVGIGGIKSDGGLTVNGTATVHDLNISGNIHSSDDGFNLIGSLVYSPDIIPTMTNDTSPSGVVTYSSEFGGGLLGFHAFDHVPTSGWTNAEFALPAYLSYQFPSPKIITSYAIQGYFISASRMIKDWTFEGSNNGLSWTVLDTETNQTGWGLHELRTYNISNLNSYTYYRVNISANNGDSYTELEEIEMYTSSLSDFKVGIGTSAPTDTLTVLGSVYNGISTSSQISEVATTTVGDAPYSITMSGRYLYVTNISGNTMSVVDVSNPLAPIQTGNTSVGTNPASVVVSGRYAYVANGSSDTVSVVDISNPSSPVEIATALVGDSPQGIAVSGHYVYTSNVSDNTISVVDISNPSSPVQIATASVGASPYFITISGRYAYVSNYSGNTISVVDISNPLSPVQVATTAVGSGPQGIVVSGSYAYVANLTAASISVVDISNPLAPTEIATASVGANPYSVAVSGRYAYVANYAGNTISIVDISNPSSPVEIATTPTGTNPYSIVVSGKYAYLTNMGDDTISVIDLAGTDVGNLLAGALEAGNINVQNNINAAGFINAGTALSVGIGGIKSDGSISITATTSSNFAGNVGIGVNSPNAKLTVYATPGSSDDVFQVASSSGVNYFKVASDGSLTSNISASGNFVFNTDDNAGNTSVLFDNGTDHHFGGDAYLDMNEGGGGNYISTLTSVGTLYLISQTSSIEMQSTDGLNFNGNGPNTIQQNINASELYLNFSDASDSGAGASLLYNKFQTNGSFNNSNGSNGGYSINDGQVYSNFNNGTNGNSGNIFINGTQAVMSYNNSILNDYGTVNVNTSGAFMSFNNNSSTSSGNVAVYTTEFATQFSDASGNSGHMYVENSGTDIYTTHTGSGSTQTYIQPSQIQFVGQDISAFHIGFGQDQSHFFIQDASGTNNFLIDPNTTLGETIISSTGSIAFMPGGSGKIGIGTTTPTANLTIEGTPTTTLLRLVNIGAGSLTSDASGNIINTSDERLKDIQGNYTKGLSEIEQLTPINYTWKSSTGLDASTTYSGFSAQNVQAVIPEAIGKNGAGFLTLNDRPIIAAIVNAIKEIGSFISKIENGIAYLKDIVVERFTVGSDVSPAGITMYDKTTKQPYCVIVNNGVLHNESGICQQTSGTTTSTATVFTPTDTETTTSTSTDIVAPIINVLGLNPEELIVNQTYADAGATATDNIDTIVSVSATGTVDVGTVGTYSILYTATDIAGNTSSSTRIINIIPEPATSTPVVIDMATSTP